MPFVLRPPSPVMNMVWLFEKGRQSYLPHINGNDKRIVTFESTERAHVSAFTHEAHEL